MDLALEATKLSSWSSGTWADHLGKSLQAVETSASLASALLLPTRNQSESPSQSSVHSAVNSAASRRSRVWSQLSGEALNDVLGDILFNYEPGSMLAEMHERKIAGMIS
jgi:hypothetical protein